MPTNDGTKSADSPYQLQLFSNLPLYTTQLVCEARFPFCERIQVSAPADVVPILQEYFRLKDREEMILVLLDTANTILGFFAHPPESVHFSSWACSVRASYNRHCRNLNMPLVNTKRP